MTTTPTPGSPIPDLGSLFSIGEGVFGRNLRKLQLAEGDRLRRVRVAFLLTSVAWLPLLLLAASEGVAWGSAVEVPFLRDFLPYGQLLVTIPVLVLGEIAASRRLRLAAVELGRSGLVEGQDVDDFEGALNRAIRLGTGRWVNAAILIIALGAAVVSFFEVDVWLTGAWQVTGDGMTMAGWWYLLVSLPIMRFLALRWMWRAVLWAWVLWKISRLDLAPKPMHPDRAGGFAFLGATQASFGSLIFVFGVQLSCLAADAVVYRGADLMAYRGHAVAFLLTSLGAVLLPLVTFAPKLARARDEQLFELSGHGYRGAGRLATRLRSGEWGTDVAGEEISGLADYGVLYENARLMRTLPVDLRDVLILVLAAVVPFVPLVFLVVPATEVVKMLAGLIV